MLPPLRTSADAWIRKSIAPQFHVPDCRRVQLDNGPAINARGRETDRMVDHRCRHGPALRERNGSLSGNSGVLSRSVDDKNHRLVGLIHDVDGPADSVEIVRRWSGRDQNQIRQPHYGPDQGCRLGRRIDDDELESTLTSLCEMLGKVIEVASKEYWRGGLAPISPPGQAPLWVSVDEDDRPLPCPLGLYSEMSRQCRLPRPALL